MESWEGAEHCLCDGIGIGYLAVEESDVESKSASIDTSLITEVNSIDIDRVGTYLIPLERWEGAEHYPIDRLVIAHLPVEEFGVESESARKVSSLNIYRTGTYLTPLESWEGAEHCPIDGIGIEGLAGVGIVL